MRGLNRIPEACKRLGGISRVTLYRLIREGSLRTVKIGGQRFVPDDAIDELIERGTQEAAKIVRRSDRAGDD